MAEIELTESEALDIAIKAFDGHPSVRNILRFFRCGHLPPHLRKISAPFGALAVLTAKGPSNAETTVALRKLLEAKDAAVRAVVAEG